MKTLAVILGIAIMAISEDASAWQILGQGLIGLSVIFYASRFLLDQPE